MTSDIVLSPDGIAEELARLREIEQFADRGSARCGHPTYLEIRSLVIELRIELINDLKQSTERN